MEMPKEDVQRLCPTATCPVCQDLFTDPVTIVGCGHSFCRACLTQSWGAEEDGEVSCPQCKKAVPDRRFISCKNVASIVEQMKKVVLQQKRREEDEKGVCGSHQKPLKLFCRDHDAPLCLACSSSKEHRGHDVIPREEAVQEYKDEILSRLETLRAERETILGFKGDSEKESQELLNQTEEKRRETQALFGEMHRLLEQQERSIMAQLEELEKEVARRRAVQLAQLNRELSLLENRIQEMEEKCLQPASEFLQDIRKTLQRYEEKEAFQNPVAFPPEFTQEISTFCNSQDVKPLLQHILKEFQAKVTLDPDTAHPNLVLSEDLKSVRCDPDPLDVPDNPERFTEERCVLGKEGFSAGTHYWDVCVDGEQWAVGVARKSVDRKGCITFGPDDGVWALEKQREAFFILSDYFEGFQLPLSPEHKRFRVTVKYEEGQVTFNDVESGAHLYTFSGIPLNGETIFPFFSVSHLRAPLVVNP